MKNFLLLLTLPMAGDAVAQDRCDVTWPDYFGPAPGGVSGVVHDTTAFDDGSGLALYAAGDFDAIGGITTNHIARFDGTSWSAVGPPDAFDPLFASLNALIAFDDGSGPALFVGGSVGEVAGQRANGVARWDGVSWSPVGSASGLGSVEDFAVFDDGAGSALYASSTSFAESKVSTWDGSSWSTVGQLSVNSYSPGPAALAVFDDGTGPALFAGGEFSAVNGVAANNIARWKTGVWQPLGAGVTSTSNPRLEALQVFDFGAGDVLVAGGDFLLAGGTVALDIAAWNGSAWSAIGSGASPPASAIGALGVQTVGNAPRLTAYAKNESLYDPTMGLVIQWDGLAWAQLGGPELMNGDVQSFTELDFGAGPEFYAGGAPRGVERWDGAKWEPVPVGFSANVHALLAHDDGSGPALFAGGSGMWFEDGQTGISAWTQVAKWTLQTGWSSLAADLTGDGVYAPLVNALAVFDDGSGPQLFAGGRFESAGGVPAASLARWDGSSWSALGSGIGLSGTVHALSVHDDGSGPALYAGGRFTVAGGITTGVIARWDGSSWSGTGAPSDNQTTCTSLEVFDFGAGPRLHAGLQGSMPTDLQVLESGAWTSVPASFTSFFSQGIETLESYDDGAGEKLYVGGQFTFSGLPAATDLVRWDGATWSALDGGKIGPVVELQALPDPLSSGGEALFVSGPSGVVAGGMNMAVNDLAKWNSAGWSALQSLPEDPLPTGPMAAFDDVLFFGGFDLVTMVLAEPCDPPLVYCSATTSSSGCQAAIGSSDPFAQPVSGAADYAVTASGVLGQKNGLLIFGISGPAAIPIQGGTLCVLPPLKRAGLQNSQGSSSTSCDGSFSWTVNTGQGPPTGVDPGPGNSGWYQWWYRDSLSPLQAALSNAQRLDY